MMVEDLGEAEEKVDPEVEIGLTSEIEMRKEYFITTESQDIL